MSSEWQRWLSVMAATVIAIACVTVVYVASALLIPIAVAIFLTFILSPLVSWLQHRGLGRTPAVVLVSLATLLVFIAIGGAIAHEFIVIAEDLPDRQDAIKEKLISARSWLFGGKSDRFGQFLNEMEEVFFPKRRTSSRDVVVEAPPPPMTTEIQKYLGPSAEILGQTALTLVLTVYMLIRREDLRNRMIRLLGSGKVTTTTKAVDEASRRVSNYLLTQAIVNTSFGAIIALGLFLMGMKYVLLWGFIAAAMRYVPYIGTWIGLILPLSFSFATAPGWVQPLGVLLLYVGLELLIANFVEPWLLGSSIGLSSVAQLVATAFWAYMWGPIGLILASPLTACLLVLGKYVRGLEFLEVLLGDEPALEPVVAFYQRLAARDQDEASAIAMQVARAKNPEAALETVVVPALAMVRRDRDRGEFDPKAYRTAIHAAREVAAELAELHEPHPADAHDERRVRLLICPARDEAEAIAAEILEGTLDPAKWEVRTAGDEVLASELVQSVQEFQPAVVVLIALPPGGLAHCRYLVSRLRARFPTIRILIGRWGNEELLAEDTADAVKKVDAEDHSLSATRKRLAALHPVLAAEHGEDDTVTR